MKKKPKSKEEAPKQIDDLEEFQATYGADWHKITMMPAFRAGLQLLNVRALDGITSLSHDDIEKYGLLILSSLIGLLKHENDMFSLHKEQSFALPSDEEMEYVSPEQEAEMESLRAKFRDQQKRQRYG